MLQLDRLSTVQHSLPIEVIFIKVVHMDGKAGISLAEMKICRAIETIPIRIQIHRDVISVYGLVIFYENRRYI